MVMVLLCSAVLTFLLPILSIPLNFVGMIITTGKIRKCYGFLFALSLALMAYIWVPGETSDLFRYHQQMRMMSGQDLWYYGDATKEVFEPVHHLFNYLVAQTGNPNLLQFFGVLLSYYGITWLICDYVETRKTKKTTFALVLLYMIVANGYIYFASSFWCFLAMICIVIGMYLRYFKNKKYLQLVFYALAAGLHIGTLYVIIFVLLFGALRSFKKVRIPILIAVFMGSLVFGAVLLWLSETYGSNFEFLAVIGQMYDDYFVNDAQFKTLHKGWNLLLPFINCVICALAAIWQSKNENFCRYGSLVAYLAIFIMATMLSAGVFLRFGFFIVISSAPILIEVLERIDNIRLSWAFSAAMLILSFAQIYMSCIKIESSGLSEQLDDYVISNMIDVINKEQ